MHVIYKPDHGYRVTQATRGRGILKGYKEIWAYTLTEYLRMATPYSVSLWMSTIIYYVSKLFINQPYSYGHCILNFKFVTLKLTQSFLKVK